MDTAKERQRETWRKWYAKNKERQAEYLKKWNLENAEKAKAIRARYYATHREHIRAQQKEYRKTHPPPDPKKLAENSRRYRERHSEDLKKRERERQHSRKSTDPEYVAYRARIAREYRAKHRAEILVREQGYRGENRSKLNAYARMRWVRDKALLQAKGKDWRAKHGEYRLRYQRDWIKKNPEKVAHHLRLRRARKNGAEGSFTREEWQALLARYENKCAYCGNGISGRNASQDHKIPLSRGGSHRIENIVPACRSCNSKKGTKTHDEFLSSKPGLGGQI